MPPPKPAATAQQLQPHPYPARFRCLLDADRISYKTVAGPLQDADAQVDWECVQCVDQLVPVDEKSLFEAHKKSSSSGTLQKAANPKLTPDALLAGGAPVVACSICLEPLDSMFVPRITRCGHCFCYGCITRYLLRDAGTGGLHPDLLAGPLGSGQKELFPLRTTTLGGSSQRNKEDRVLGARKCPVCNKTVHMADLRPTRFQFCEKAVTKFVLVHHDPERPGISEIPSSHLVVGNHVKVNPKPLPRERVDVGWHFSRLALMSEAAIQNLRRNDILGLIRRAWEIRKTPNDGETEMLPFFDFLIGQELQYFNAHFPTTTAMEREAVAGTGKALREQFLREHVLIPDDPEGGGADSSEGVGTTSRTAVPAVSELYPAIVYDRTLNLVEIDFGAELAPVLRGATSLPPPANRDAPGPPEHLDWPAGEESSRRASVNDVVLVEEVDASGVEERKIQDAEEQTASADPTNTIPTDKQERPRSGSADDEDDWLADRGAVGEATSLVEQAVSTPSRAAPPSTPASGPLVPPPGKQSVFFYQAWDSQPVFLSSFCLTVLRADREERIENMPAVLDVRDPTAYGFLSSTGGTWKKHHRGKWGADDGSLSYSDWWSGDWNSSTNSRNYNSHNKPDRSLEWRELLTVTSANARGKQGNRFLKSLPLFLEICLVDFDVAKFVSEQTTWRFQSDLEKRLAQHRKEQRRQKKDEKWVEHKAKNADEKYVESLKQQSWLATGHANAGTIPDQEKDFDVDLALSKKIAESEKVKKRALTDEELAVLMSLHEEELIEKRKRVAKDRKSAKKEKERREKEAEILRQERARPLRDGWSDSEGDVADREKPATTIGLEVDQQIGTSSDEDDSREDPKIGPTFAEKMRLQKESELQKKRDEETARNYFPSLAETTGMVSLGGGKRRPPDSPTTSAARAKAMFADPPPQEDPSTEKTMFANPPNSRAGASTGPAVGRVGDSQNITPWGTTVVVPTRRPAGTTTSGSSGREQEKQPIQHLPADAMELEERRMADRIGELLKEGGNKPAGAGKAGKAGKKKKPQKIQLFG